MSVALGETSMSQSDSPTGTSPTDPSGFDSEEDNDLDTVSRSGS